LLLSIPINGFSQIEESFTFNSDTLDLEGTIC